MEMNASALWRKAGRVWVQGLLLLGLRLAQLRVGFDQATGLAIPSIPGKVLAVVIAICIAAELVLCLRLPKGRASFARHFAPPEDPAPFFFGAAGDALLALGGAVLLAGAVPDRRVTAIAAGLLGVIAGAGLLLLMWAMCIRVTDIPVWPLLPSMFFGVFFVLTVYLPEENDPVLARFYLPVLAAALTAYAFGQLAGFLRQEGSLRSYAFTTNLAVMLCLAATADGGGLGRVLIFAGCAMIFTIFSMMRREGVAPDVEDKEEPNVRRRAGKHEK